MSDKMMVPSDLTDWITLARRDDWHITFVGSDIRCMLAEIERLRKIIASTPQPAAPTPLYSAIPQHPVADRAALQSLEYWCTDERGKVNGIDGYNYASGEEYGIRKVEIEIAKRIRAIADAKGTVVEEYRCPVHGDNPDTDKCFDCFCIAYGGANEPLVVTAGMD